MLCARAPRSACGGLKGKLKGIHYRTVGGAEHAVTCQRAACHYRIFFVVIEVFEINAVIHVYRKADGASANSAASDERRALIVKAEFYVVALFGAHRHVLVRGGVCPSAVGGVDTSHTDVYGQIVVADEKAYSVNSPVLCPPQLVGNENVGVSDLGKNIYVAVLPEGEMNISNDILMLFDPDYVIRLVSEDTPGLYDTSGAMIVP